MHFVQFTDVTSYIFWNGIQFIRIPSLFNSNWLLKPWKCKINFKKCFLSGIFTAPRPGLYSFSFTVYSKMGGEGERMYYKVQLMRNGEVMASTWEDNREDSEDSSSQTVLLLLQQGGQVYVELLTGRQLCGNVKGLNTFSGSLIYPALA